MTNTKVAERMAEKVSKAILNAGTSVLKLSETTGIPYSTLNRKLKGRSEFAPSELLIIAAALNVAPWSFLPEQFQSKQVA